MAKLSEQQQNERQQLREAAEAVMSAMEDLWALVYRMTSEGVAQEEQAKQAAQDYLSAMTQAAERFTERQGEV